MTDTSEKNVASLVKEGGLRHIAFIMDGNGRWAKARHMPREMGHKAGYDSFKRILRYCCGTLDIETVTIYAFSTENWQRPDKEVSALMKLFDFALAELRNLMMKENLQVHFLGDKSRFSDDIAAKMVSVEEDSKNNKFQLNIAANYGGRDEIVHAARLAAENGEEINEDNLSRHMYTSASPDPDLIVRTAGEMRLSNFLLWQCAYSEFYCTSVLWPDLTPEDIDRAVIDFSSRKRKYGKI